MNLSIIRLSSLPNSERIDHLNSLKNDREKLKERLDMENSDWNAHAKNNYYWNLCRLVHFLACQKLSEKVFKKNYNTSSIQDYFAKKIQLQREIYQYNWDEECDPKEDFTEHIIKAKEIIHDSDSLTKDIVNYVNREEDLFFRTLPKLDQSKVLYQVYRDRLWSLMRRPLGLISAATVGAIMAIGMKTFLTEIPRYLNGCVSGCEPLI